MQILLFSQVASDGISGQWHLPVTFHFVLWGLPALFL